MSTFFLFAALLQTPITATVEISGIREQRGQILVAVYSSEEDYMDEDRMAFSMAVAVDTVGTQVFILELPEGTYAISAFHDVNGDDRLNKNLVGVPTEPYGFSNGARGVFGPPAFGNAKVDVTADSPIHIALD